MILLPFCRPKACTFTFDEAWNGSELCPSSDLYEFVNRYSSSMESRRSVTLHPGKRFSNA